MALSKTATDANSAMSLARLLIERGKLNEAGDLLAAVSSKEEVPPEFMFVRADLAVRRTDAADAYEVLSGIIRKWPAEFDRAMAMASDPAIAAAFRKFAEEKAGATPDDVHARLILAQLLIADGRRNEAIAILRDVVNKYPKLGPAHAALAVSLRAGKNWDETIKAADEAIANGVKSVGVCLAKADSHAALDQDEAAENAYLAAFEADKTSGEALFRLAELASRRGQYRRCEQLYRRVLDDVDPRHMLARERLVVHYLNRGDIDKCREYFGDFAALKLAGPSERVAGPCSPSRPARPTPPQGRLDEYLAALGEILKDYPNDAATHAEIARSHGAVNHYDDALASIDRAVDLDPDDVSARELKASLLAKLLRFHDAAVVVRSLLADRPRDLGYLQDLLRFADSEGDWDTAATLLREFLARDDLKAQRSAFTSMLINTLIHAERWDEAIEAAKKWLDDSPEDVLRRGMYLAALGRAGRHDEAVALAKDYLAKEPDNRVTQMTLLQRLQEAKRFTEAIQYTLSWLGDAPDDIDLNLALIRLCWSARKWDEAIEIARTNAERSESRTSFESLLGDTYRFARRYDEAIELYKERVAKWEKRRRKLETELRRAADPTKERKTLIELRESIAEAKQANYSLVGVLISAERYAQAERAINRLLRPELEAREGGQPFDQSMVIDLRNLLSEIYQDTDRLSQSVQQLEEIYKMDPEDPGINNNFGYTLVDSGLDLDRGERMIRFSLAQNPKSHASLDSLGWALASAAVSTMP
ncbi:MAG: tetratricopeptide repeat protein [Planctomycetes bacterium]|nr:tetratricopeptide repeat protein [Planctomycetota bacterium]